MTTPENTFPEPYGKVFVGTGTTTALTPYYTGLPPGVNTLMVSWAESSGLEITQSPSQSNAARVVIATIPAGSGRRSITIPGIGVNAGEEVWIGLRRADRNNAAPTERATITVVTMPIKGGDE